MGKTKMFADEFSQGKANKQQQYNKGGSKDIIAHRFQGSSEPENIPLHILLRQVAMRLRRTWVALRFHIDTLSMGLFRKHLMVKVAAICALSYALFGSENAFFRGPDNGVADQDGISILAENNLQGPSRPKTASKKKKNSEQSAFKSNSKSDAAPISKVELANADQRTRNYIQRYHKIAIEEMRRYGVPASISLAQGLIESRCGTSKLAVNNNNHFGIKCFDRGCKKGHCSNHTDDSHKDFFRIYATPWECWRAHSIMISTGRYAKLKKYGRDYRRWAYGLKSAGYATDKTYASKLIGVIERYNLQRFDK